MPIITTQRRMAEQGRIRLGAKVTGTTKDGREYTRPDKLSAFRFTSPSQRLIDEIATQYGGTARPWDNAGKSEFEVLSDATAIPVIVVKGGFSQWHEHWTKAGCQHRCDGEKDVAGTFCDPDDPMHLAAIEKPTTRLSVMLSEIESLGVWRMESKGWNAAAELPSMAELAMHVGDLVPATLGLAERSSIIQTDKGPQTSRYVVPFLDLHVTKARLVEIVGGPGGTRVLDGPAQGPAAIEAGGSTTPPDPWPAVHEQVKAAQSTDDLSAIWVEAVKANLVGSHAPVTEQLNTFALAFKARADQVKTATPPAAAPAAESDADGIVDAEIVPDPTGGDEDVIWQRIVTEAGKQGMSLPDLQDHFLAQMGGLSSDQASADELTHFYGLLTQAEQVPA